jgi:hypothetical protein
VLSLSIVPKKLAKRFAAQGPTSATSAGTTIGRPKAFAGSTIARPVEEVAATALVWGSEDGETLVTALVTHRPPDDAAAAVEMTLDEVERSAARLRNLSAHNT